MIALLSISAMATVAKGSVKAVERIDDARVAFQEIMDAGDQSIPLDLLRKAHCIAIVPGLKKAGFIAGAKYGKGVLMCRQMGGGWRSPATVRMEGGSLGLQIGAGEVDVILLVMNESGAKKLMKSEFTLGASGAMAGPLGRTVQAETDAYLRAQILGYSRSRGVFAGAVFEGATLREDLDDNNDIYGKRLSNEEILLQRKSAPPGAARSLVDTLNRYSVWEKVNAMNSLKGERHMIRVTPYSLCRPCCW